MPLELRPHCSLITWHLSIPPKAFLRKPDKLRSNLGAAVYKQDGLAQSREGAKEEEEECSKSKLCASAPLREKLLPPELELLYGSRAKVTYRPDSDIDFALYGSGLGQTLLARIEEELDDLLLPYQMDLLLLANLTHPELLDHIRRVGVTLYE